MTPQSGESEEKYLNNSIPRTLKIVYYEKKASTKNFRLQVFPVIDLMTLIIS